MKYEFLEQEKLDYEIQLEAMAWRKFMYLMGTKYDKEFTAFCHAERDEYDPSIIRIYDLFFPRQENTGITTECDGIDVMNLELEGADITKLCGHMH